LGLSLNNNKILILIIKISMMINMLKHLNNNTKIKSSLRFFKIQVKNIHGFYFTRQSNTDAITKSGVSVPLYEAPEWREINDYLQAYNYYDIIPKDNQSETKMKSIWTNCVMNGQFKPKYFALLPFFVEDRQTIRAKKKFVLNMELYPESKYMKITLAMISGVISIYEPLEDIVPITPGDYRVRHLMLRSRPPAFVDMDMVYGNRKILNMYCFDKQGTWNKEV
jgi:hypothetical protein